MPGLKTEAEWFELHCRNVLQPPQKGRARSQLSPSRTPWVGLNISFGQALLASFEMVVLKYLYMRNKRRSYASPRLSHIDFLTLQQLEQLEPVNLADQTNGRLTSSAQERDESVPSRSCNRDLSNSTSS